ncbi:MAG: RHS repeat domain-containing protein, partial [Casimicrobium sp.]
ASAYEEGTNPASPFVVSPSNHERPHTTQVTKYRYDPLGRRIDKTDTFAATRFIYDGDLLIGELRGSKLSEYLYEPNSFVPLAKLESEWKASERTAPQDGKEDNEETAEQGLKNLQALAQLVASNPAAAEAQRIAIEQQKAKAKVLFGESDELDEHLQLLPTNIGRSEQKQAFSENNKKTSIAQLNRATKRFAVYYYHCDQIGAPQELTDEQGKIVWAASYKVWGETESLQFLKTGTDDRPQDSYQVFSRNTRTIAYEDSKRVQSLNLIEQPIRFQGQYFDQETQLHYNRFRYYDPVVGRFIHQDPIGLKGGFNLFTSIPNPFAWSDARGLSGDKV